MTNWIIALQRLEGAYSEHTLRGYAADMGQFASWCARQGYRALPAEPSVLVAFVDDEARRLLPSTLNRRLCGVGRIHRLLRFPDPTKDEDVLLALRRARQKRPTRPRQAFGITGAVRDRLVASCDDGLIGFRDEILVRVGFDTLCRRGELVALRAQGLVENSRGNLSILVRRAKNDQSGQGRLAPLSSKTSMRVREWLAKTQIVNGPLLRPVYRDRVIRRYLDPQTIARVLKKLTNRGADARHSDRGVSGHSLRVGAAQQLTLDRHGILPIMRAGGWRSVNVVARYIENVDLDLWS